MWQVWQVSGVYDIHGAVTVLHSVILKGSAMAAYYPVPELRKSGDLDILVSKNADLKQICEILSDDGIKKAKDQHANHHMQLTTRVESSV